jgi:hypothetical protein
MKMLLFTFLKKNIFIAFSDKWYFQIYAKENNRITTFNQCYDLNLYKYIIK